jgi:hypothetical protein
MRSSFQRLSSAGSGRRPTASPAGAATYPSIDAGWLDTYEARAKDPGSPQRLASFPATELGVTGPAAACLTRYATRTSIGTVNAGPRPRSC